MDIMLPLAMKSNLPRSKSALSPMPYSPLSSDNLLDDKEEPAYSNTTSNDDTLPKSHSPLLRQRFAIALLILICLSLLAIGLATSLSSSHHHDENKIAPPRIIYETHVSSATKTNANPHLCGNSTASALAANCTFDQLTWSWLPPHCPHYGNDEFLAAAGAETPYKYYLDPEGHEIVSPKTWQKDVLGGELMIFGERREHVSHCVFVFLALGQILRDGGKYIPKLVEYEHVHHCAMLLFDVVRKEEDWRRLQTIVGTVSYDQSC